ncbi:MacB family efflux pump subunit [Klebsiella oxytoca]|uniref:MacB family efflux pump subunit n=1 Tax=Klebsiella oxytoca TaxID=571 RepID=UPI0035711BB1|nr:MacB family efflux pump subunit [Klebsiella oxytoca]HCB2157648.1 MacB family efflux pump subunit [Klebsiella oxytoca]
MEPLISIHSLNRFFGEGQSRVQVLDNIHLEIARGDFVAIMGTSGSGKTTLMNIIGCLDQLISGSYKLDGQEVANMDDDQLADLRLSTFGFIFQRYNLLSTLTAVDNVVLPSVYAGVSGSVRQKRALELLEQLNLAERSDNRPNELSGGQQQRVSIARALMNGGKIILADEPTGALDSKSGMMVMDILRMLNRQGHTVILVTHDKNIAENANRVIELRDGKIINDIVQQPPEFVKTVAVQKPNRGFSFYREQIKEAFAMSVKAIIAHKLRSLLTMLGIIIGITSVVSVVALGNGSQQKILENISSLGTNTLDIFNGSGFGDTRSDKTKALTIADAVALGQQGYIEGTTPNSSVSGTLTFSNKSLSATVKGVGDGYFETKGISTSEGYPFGAEDVNRNTSVAVIDENTRERIFGHDDPLDKIIIFNKRPLRVIGVAVTKNNMAMNTSDLTIFVPYTTVMNKISGKKNIDSITVRMSSAVDSAVAEKSITELMVSRHGKKDFYIMNSDTLKRTIETTTNTLKMLISLIAFISLAVGGIGVMNIMLVSVTERTREIGIRRAVGARQVNILRQFLIESILICMTGGIIGILLSFAIGFIFNQFIFGYTMIFSSFSVFSAVLCSTLIGVIFGYIPARNASQLNPIEAISRD